MFVFSIIGFFVAFALNLIDSIIYFFTSFFTSKKKEVVPAIQSVEVDVPTKKGEGKPRMNAKYPKELVATPVEGLLTLNELWDNAAAKYKNKKCTLNSISILTFQRFGELKWQTFTEVDERIKNFANGLAHLTYLKPGDYFGFFENTRPKWMIGAQACFRSSFPVVTVYSNLGEDALMYSINQTKMQAIFCNASSIQVLKKLKKEDKIPTLKYIIFANEYKNEEKVEGLEICSFSEVEEVGKKQTETKLTPPKPDDVAVIMYTSGSTGNPKGVVIYHRNLVSVVAAFSECLGDISKDTHIAYLPLAHIFELGVEIAILVLGACVGYGSPRTLTDANAKPVGDLKAIKPTLMIAVPRIYDTIKKGAMEKVNNGGAITKWIFQTALAAKKRAVQNGKDTPLWNLLVFNKFKENLGGRTTRLISGGAPLSKESQEFLRLAFGAVTVQGYGLTETCAGGTVQDVNETYYTAYQIGPPIPSCQIKLVDVEDMKYFSSSNPPQGEICIKGLNVSGGYFNEEEKTKEAYDQDGWFHTGDIGQWEKNGTLRIIDRKKNLVKLAHGEYVAIEHLESIYGGNPFVAPNGIVVYGDSYKNSLVGIVLPQASYLQKWAEEHKISGSMEELCKNPKVIAALLKSLKENAAHHKKKSFEEVKDIRLFADEWTPENGMLTAAMKLKRSAIIEKYKSDIDEMYSKLEQ
eukprot:gene9750-2077_t